MALTILGTGRFGPTIGSLQLSCSVEEKHRITNQVTDFPIESGFGVTDHILRKQDVLEIHGIISDAAVTVVDIARHLAAGGSDSIQVAYAKLAEMVTQKSIFKVITGVKVYDNMTFEHLELKRDKRTGKVLDFTATLRSIEFVFSASVPIAAAERIAVPKYKGKQTPTATTAIKPTVPAAIQSPAKALADHVAAPGKIADMVLTPAQTFEKAATYVLKALSAH